MYECALVTLVLVFIILVILHVGIPLYFKHRKKKQDMTDAAIKQMNEKDRKLLTKDQIKQKENIKKIRYKKIVMPTIVPEFNINFFKLQFHQRCRF